MIRQRALAWAAVLALVATVPIAPLPTRFSAPVALAQDDSAADAGEPTDLAIVALLCAEAPAAEALTSFFTDGAAPTECAPAVGVEIAVTENGAPVAGSPFTTDVAGSLVLPVGLGSAVEVREDPTSLPAGYEPLTQEANSVPYANPVQLDPAVAGAAVLFVNVPTAVASELGQGAPAAEAGEPTDLAIVALQCADAPEAEALTSFFSSGTPPGGCAPAEGVSIAVTENEKPLSGSPFTTDADGILAVRVGEGSAVEVKEDPKSLPAGYEPITQEANGVPYANPVQLDSATPEAAVLFVNVPASVAARLNQGSPAIDAGGATNLANAGTRDRTGCDPAYPDERTCIAPGRPLAAPCAITDQRNFTVLPPDPRRLDADRDGIGCEPVSPRGGTTIRAASPNQTTSGGYLRRAAPARTSDVAVAASPTYRNYAVRSAPPQGSRGSDWVVQRDGSRAGLWFAAPNRGSTGNLAVVSNPVFIGHGLWTWRNRFGQDDWFWHRRNHDSNWFWHNRNLNGVWFRPSTISVGNLTVAGSGNGNVAIASNPVFISHGVRAWPDRGHDGDWGWRNRFGIGSWHRSNQISVGNVTVAGSRNGNIAIASNPVFIGNGLWSGSGHSHDGWFWRGRDHDDDWSWRDRFGKGVWGWPDRIAIGNLVVARSGNDLQNVAVASNPVFIGNGIWSWPNHSGNDDWIRQRHISVGNITVAGSGNGLQNVAIASNPIFIGGGLRTWTNQPGNNDWRWRNHSGNSDWHWRNRLGNNDWNWRNRFGNGIWGRPSTISVGNLTIAGSGNGNVAIASNPVFISSGVWHWPGHLSNRFWLRPNRMNNDHWRWPNRFGHGVWGWPRTIAVGNLTVARSGDNIAIVSNPIVITSGVWFVPHDRDHDRDWLNQNDRDHNDRDHNDRDHSDRDRGDDRLMQSGVAEADGSDVEPLAVNGSVASETPPSKIEPAGSSEQPALTVNGLAVEQQPDDAMQPPAEPVQAPGEGDVALPSEGTVESPSDGTVTSQPDAAVQPPADTGAPDASYVAPDPSSVDTSSIDASNVNAGYVEPDPTIDPGYVAPDPGVDPGYVDPGYVAPEPVNVAPEPVYVAPEPDYVDPGYAAPEPVYVEPTYVEPTYVEPTYVEPTYVEPTYVDPGYAAPDPVIEPSYSAPQPSYVDPGIDAGYAAPEPNYVAPEPNYVAPEPNYVAPEPNYVDAGNVAPNPGMDAGNGGPDPNNFAPEPSSVDVGNGNPGNADAGNIAPDAGMDGGGTVDAGSAEPDSGGGGRGKRKNRD
jgi:hypothetical protein